MSNRPSDVVTGVRRIFSVPAVYCLAQRAVGAGKLRERLIDQVLESGRGTESWISGAGQPTYLRTFPPWISWGFDHNGH